VRQQNQSFLLAVEFIWMKNSTYSSNVLITYCTCTALYCV